MGGVFVWALESTLLALLGFATILLTQTLGGGKGTLAVDMWAMLVVLGSCLLNLGMHTLVAMTSKHTTIPSVPGSSMQLNTPHLHKAIAQGHCCIVSIVFLLYLLIMQRSLKDLNWANAYYSAAPGLVWLTSCISMSFLTVLCITAVAGAWAATALGDYNSLFCTLPTTSVACILYPIIHEIGTNGLMVCTSTAFSSMTLLHANLMLASCFTLTILDCVEFDPVRILPRFMRTVGDRMPFFRVYSLLHGLCVSAALVLYAFFARRISWFAIILLLTLNGVLTVVSTLGLGRFIAPAITEAAKESNAVYESALVLEDAHDTGGGQSHDMGQAVRSNDMGHAARSNDMDKAARSNDMDKAARSNDMDKAARSNARENQTFRSDHSSLSGGQIPIISQSNADLKNYHQSGTAVSPC